MSPTYRDFMLKKSLKFKRSKSHTWAPLSKVSPVPLVYQFLVYAVILHSCSNVAHIKVTEAHCCRKCPLSYLLWTTMFSGVTDSLYSVHCAHPVHSLVLLSIVGIVYILSLAKSYKMTLRDKKNPGKWLWLDKVISETLKPLKLVLCSSREIVSLKKIFKLFFFFFWPHQHLFF